MTHLAHLPAHAGSVFDRTFSGVILKPFLNDTKHGSSIKLAFPPPPQSSDMCDWSILDAPGCSLSADVCRSPARIRAGKRSDG